MRAMQLMRNTRRRLRQKCRQNLLKSKGKAGRRWLWRLNEIRIRSKSAYKNFALQSNLTRWTVNLYDKLIKRSRPSCTKKIVLAFCYSFLKKDIYCYSKKRAYITTFPRQSGLHSRYRFISPRTVNSAAYLEITSATFFATTRRTTETITKDLFICSTSVFI